MKGTLNRRRRFSADVLIDTGLLILGIFFLVLVAEYPRMARTFPQLVLIMIIVVTILDILGKIWKRPSGDAAKEDDGEKDDTVHPHRAKVVYMTVLIFVFLATFLIFGLPLGVFIFLFFAGWTLGYRRPVVLAGSSLAITGFVYVIFEVIMQSRMPQGLLFNLLGG